jgi:hypothetical protein
MGLAKHFYTHKNEGGRLSAAEQKFFGLRPPSDEKKQKKEKTKKPDVPKDVASILDGLI